MTRVEWLSRPLSLFLILALGPWLEASPEPLLVQEANESGTPLAVLHAKPLQTLVVDAGRASSVEVRDSSGMAYFSAPSGGQVSFKVGGALGNQEVVSLDSSGDVLARGTFTVDAETSIEDGGKYSDMFTLFRNGMKSDQPTGVVTTRWNGKTYHYFVNWVLDNYHTSKGMRYFSPYVTELVDMMREAQREDGMIWSNLNSGEAVAYYKTAYGPFGYVRKIGDRYFVRQPAENHPEYIYVSSIYQSWKTCGNDAWMARCLPSAMRALDYCVTDPARWSQKFQLLKRVYTIDSWDFQVDDSYTPDIGLTNTMLVDPKKSKFGIFFGDNIYYAAACEELSEMLVRSGDPADAAKYGMRATAIRQRLDALSWNGSFYTHFVDEDPSVKRDLGVDEKTQLAQGNAYALNRGVGPEHAAAIIETYIRLSKNLPPGSPGEWYSIYPPFQRGFSQNGAIWQYMNGGVGGHVAGELARGAFENGYEAYARDILDRLARLGHEHGNKIWFSYTGSIPKAPSPPRFAPLDLSGLADMNILDQAGPGAQPWMGGGRSGDDIRGLPTGNPVFAGIPFKIAAPSSKNQRIAIAVSHRAGLPASVEVPVKRKAGCVYLLHTSTKPGSEGVCGSLSFNYKDGSKQFQYMVMGRQLTYWWFPELKTETSGVAWHGPSPVADDVGLSWCAINNPHPDRPLASISLNAADGDGIYVVVGMTLADREHYVAPNPISFGGPDNWAAATAMDALIEGMAGVKDTPLSQALSAPILSPRWDLGQSRSILVTVRYPACNGYVAYRFVHDLEKRQIVATVAGNANEVQGHFLLPSSVTRAKSVKVDQVDAPYRISRVADSCYVDFELKSLGVHTVQIGY